MTRPLRPALTAAFLILIFAGTTPFISWAYSRHPAAKAKAAFPGITSISGGVVDPRGFDVNGIAVTARSETDGKQYETVTDKAGHFLFANIGTGAYVVTTQFAGVDRAIKRVIVEANTVAPVELLVSPVPIVDNSNLTKFILSSEVQGGRYPAGNISYLNTSDSTDLYFMWVYFGILILLSIYGIYRYRLVYLFLRYRNQKPEPKSRFATETLPSVTVQLPLFNEMYVAERLINSVAELDYPRELFEIQVLDDSTDQTQEIASAVVDKYRERGLNISYHHRTDRTGFKAGALEAGLKKAAGDLVLVFDADFLPRPDCIRKMVDYFTDEKVGLVQLRWSHINADYSLLTKTQAIMLDGHFVIEQTARNRCGGFFNFNGTAGMWRRQAIEWSGGWQHDTLAEDTDLSYRAQLMGWKFVYLLDDDVPSELPVDMNAFKAQQRRWAKGLVQVGLKMLKRIWRDPRLPFKVKLEQFFRLTGNLAAPLVIVLALVNFPVLIVRYNQGFFHLFVLDVPILTFSTISVIVFYVVPQWHLYPKTWKSSLKYMPFVLSMGIALTFSNTRAVLEAICGVKTPFVRTPKYGINDSSDATWVKKQYARRRSMVPVLEVFFALYFVFTVWYAVYSHILGTIPFLLIYLIGYAYAAVMSIGQTRINMRRAAVKRASDPS